MSEGEVTAPGGVVYSVAASIIRESILDSEGIWGTTRSKKSVY